MLLMLLATGVVPEESGTVIGPFDVPDERIAIAKKVQGASSVAVGLPLGAAQWEQPFDPSDRLPFGMSFVELLDAGETITSIDRIALSSTAAGLGVIIEQASPRAPVIDEIDLRRLQLWLSVDDAMQAAASYDASGVRFPVTFRVTTSKGRRFERSAILTVRQL